jgi:hypothetical protein
MKSTVAQSAGVSRAARWRVGVWILSLVKIGSDHAGEEKSMFPEEIRLVTAALGADMWPIEMFQSLTFAFLQAAPTRRVPGA